VTVTAADINNGSFDADGDSVTCALSSSGGPLPPGINNVGLVCTDSAGLFSSCAATVTVGGGGQASPWSSTTTYVAGNLVTFGGFTFEARQGSTGYAPTLPNASPPDTNVALWEVVTPCGITAWLDETHYQVGSMVTFNGTTYTCILDHVALFNWTPAAVPSLWRVANGSDQPICPCTQ
jgi:chitin-binding protein